MGFVYRQLSPPLVARFRLVRPGRPDRGIGRERIIALTQSAMWDRVSAIFNGAMANSGYPRGHSAAWEEHPRRVSIADHRNGQYQVARAGQDPATNGCEALRCPGRPGVFILDADIDEHEELLQHA